MRPEIATILRDLFKHSGPVTLETTQDDVEKWNSLQHLWLIMALEEKFGISMSMDEMIEVQSVSGIVRVLDRYGV